MSESSIRYFTNNLRDYKGGDVKIPKKDWKKRILEIVRMIKEGEPVKDYGGGIYVGSGGIAYMFCFLSQLPLYEERRDSLMSAGFEYLEASLKYVQSDRTSHRSGFLTGHAGVYAVAAVINNIAGNTKDAEKYLNIYLETDLKFEYNELFVGRAGYLAGALWLEKHLGGMVPLDTIKRVCDSMVRRGREYASKNNSPCPLMYAYHGHEYVGAAHGLSSILQMILTVPESMSRDPEIENDVRLCVDYLLSLQSPAGNFPPACSSNSNPNELVQWCHGAPGVIYLMAKAYLHWRDERYLESCIKCGEVVWNKGLLKKGPGICHGVAGNGYAFLLLFRLSNNKKYLHRAQEFARFMFTSTFEDESRIPDNPYSLFEGWAGTACYLADLTQPEEAAFPFLDVF